MVQLVQNKPLETREPSITIDAGLPAGSHRFQLEVEDAAGLRSKADIAVVAVQRLVVGPLRPDVVLTPVTPVVTPVTPVVRPVVTPIPGRVPRRPT